MLKQKIKFNLKTKNWELWEYDTRDDDKEYGLVIADISLMVIEYEQERRLDLYNKLVK